jgi:hypothetical protein
MLYVLKALKILNFLLNQILKILYNKWMTLIHSNLRDYQRNLKKH